MITTVSATKLIFKREFAAFFATPLAYVFLVIFLILNGVFTFYLGGLFERGQADLVPFFEFHPWLYLFLVPAVSMSLWAEEKRSGNIEMMTTLPLSLVSLVLGKFLSSWCFVGLALILTFPVWVTVNYLGDPDNGTILAAYFGSWMMAGAYLAIGSFVSASTNNPVIAFLISVAVCFLFLMAGFPMVTDFFSAFLPHLLVEVVSSLSLLVHFKAISKGVVDFRDLFYFVGFAASWLLAAMAIIEQKKAS